MKILFVTGNQHKFAQVKGWLKELDPSIELIQKMFDLPECQSLDVEEVATKKVRDAWDLFKTPLIIDDGGVYFANYPQFPGTLTKYVFKALHHAGLWKIMKDNPRGWFTHCIAYVDGNGIKLFKAKVDGGFIETPRGGTDQSPVQMSRCFIPDGSERTFSEMEFTEEEKRYHSRYKAIIQLIDWLKARRQGS